VAEAIGTFAGYAVNEQPFLEVIRMHRDAVAASTANNVSTALSRGAELCGKRGRIRPARTGTAMPR